MFEIIKIYPLIFIFTVIIPVVGGMVGGYIGWDSLQSRHEDSTHKQKLTASLNTIDEKLELIARKTGVMERYEHDLSSFDQKDEVLSAVLAQYKKMKTATEDFHRFRDVENEVERGKLAEHILSTITDNLVPVTEAKHLPNQPLILGLSPNVFKVIFAVPARIPPKLEFQGTPEGVTAHISEHTKFGFVVKFLPLETPVTNFGFTGDARL